MRLRPVYNIMFFVTDKHGSRKKENPVPSFLFSIPVSHRWVVAKRRGVLEPSKSPRSYGIPGHCSDTQSNSRMNQ